MPDFPVDGPINATIRIAAGKLRVTAEARESVTVDVRPGERGDAARQAAEDTIVEMTADGLLIETPQARGFIVRRTPSVDITVRMPQGSHIMVRSASADIVCGGRYGSADIKSASGDLEIDDVAGDFHRNSASGDTQFGRVGGEMSSNSASGDLRGGSVGGEFSGKSASGDITVGAVGGPAHVTTASGDIQIGNLARGQTNIHSASGDVSLGVAVGTAVWMDVHTLSGSTRSDLDVSDSSPTGGAASLELSVRTASGGVTIRRATTAPAAPGDAAPAAGSDGLTD